MQNKRGQVYLFAAIIIMGIILSLATISNTIRTAREETKVNELADAMNIELGKIVEYKKIDSNSPPMNILLLEFTEYYAKEYANQERTTYFVYILDNIQYKYKYEKKIVINTEDITIDINNPENKFTTTILGNSKEFELSNEEKTIYFVLYETDNEGNNAWAYR